MPPVFPTYRPPKHPSNLPLMPRNYTILIIHLLTNSPRNPCTSMFPRLCPRLIAPEDLVPLLVRPIDVFFCKSESFLPILFRNKRFPSCYASCKPLLLKRCTYCIFAAVKAKDTRNRYPRRLAVLIRGCYPFD